MISDVASGVLVDVIAAAGHWLTTSAVAIASRRQREGLEVARWFDTYQLTMDPPDFPELPAAMHGQLDLFLRGNDAQAALHELLAARLTDAPEADAERVRRIFLAALSMAPAELAKAAGELFSYFDGQICDLTGRLEGSEPALLAQIRAEAFSTRMIAILGAIERHAAALSSPRELHGDTAFLDAYRRHVVGHHGQIDPPDFERRIRVPIADLYVPPVITQVVDSEPHDRRREIDLWALAGEIDRTVLLGDPGGGKTTAANVLMHHFASKLGRKVPFMVTLREFAKGDGPGRSVAGYINYRLETFYQCPAPPNLTLRLLLSGGAVVIFDGLDELLDTFCRRIPPARLCRRTWSCPRRPGSR